MEQDAKSGHHPLPSDEKARLDEVPETQEQDKGFDRVDGPRGQPPAQS